MRELSSNFGAVCAAGRRLVTNKLLVEGKDFVLLPEVIWKVFVSWYCSSAYNIIPTLPRSVSNPSSTTCSSKYGR